MVIVKCAETGKLVGQQDFSQTLAVSDVATSSDDGQDVEGAGCRENMDLFSFLHPSTFDLVCVGSAIAAFLCLALLVGCWLRHRHQKVVKDLAFDDSLEAKIIKSAPASRLPSPKLSKCKSCPDALSASTNTRDALGPSVIPGPATERAPPELTITGDDGHTIAHFDGNVDGASLVTPGLRHLFKDGDHHYSEPSSGCLWYSLVYAEDEKLLYVNLIKAENLPGRNSSSHLRDPFVKMYLLPDEKVSRVSEVKKNTLNPVFNETHTFQIPADDVRRHKLRFSIYDVDKRRLRHCLGHVVINLRNAELTKGQVSCSKLEPTIQNATSIGELQFSLLYIPFSEKIKITIKKARNLQFMEDKNPVGVYVRVQLYYGHKFHNEKQTVVHHGEAGVTFNESVIFKTCGLLLSTCNLKISVMLMSYKPNVAVSETEHGRVVVGTFLFAHGDELAHWQEMMSAPELDSTHWHTLTRTTSSS